MHNLQTFETPKKAKKWLSVRTKLSVDTRMLKTCLGKFHDFKFVEFYNRAHLTFLCVSI